MDQGYQEHGTEQPAARRARRLTRWRARARDTRAAARPAPAGAAETAAWFDDWLAGAEESDRAATAAAAAPEGWRVLRDLHRPGSAERTVDLVAVGPGGVVVIETLRWDGRVEVVNGTLRHRGYGRTPDVAAVADTAGAVTSLLAPTHRRAVHAVLCLAGSDLDPTAVRGGAVAVGERRLTAYLRALPERLADADVPLVVDYLTAELAGAASPELLTVDDVFRPREVWSAPDVPHPHAGPGPGTGLVGGGPDTTPPGQDTSPGTPPGTETAPPARTAVGPTPGVTGTPPRPSAPGDGLLRVGLLVLGLLTAGNVLLAWLDAAG
jgi:hypothetical protein